METTVKSLGMDTTAAHTLLPEVHQPVHTTLLPIHTHLLGIRTGSHQETRTLQGDVARRQENTEMQPMGWQRLRPGAVSFLNDSGPRQPY